MLDYYEHYAQAIYTPTIQCANIAKLKHHYRHYIFNIIQCGVCLQHNDTIDYSSFWNWQHCDILLLLQYVGADMWVETLSTILQITVSLCLSALVKYVGKSSFFFVSFRNTWRFSDQKGKMEEFWKWIKKCVKLSRNGEECRLWCKLGFTVSSGDSNEFKQ